MSHTTTLRGIKMTDAHAIEQAVADLKAKGISISLLKNAKPRMYYAHQAAEVGNCDYVLKLPGRYDVGFKKDAKTGEYVVFMDTWGGDIKNAIGAACPLSQDQYDRAGEHAIGQFTQRYGVNAAKNEARNNGLFVTETMSDTGEIQLVVEGY